MSANEDTNGSLDESANQPGRLPVPRERIKWHWARRFLAGNPLYLISAALLLFGVNRLSVDPNFLGAELAKLVFNFSALEIYEVLVVIVAIVLARRRIWYDSTLLFGLENILVLVPFILVTEALMIGNGVALAFGLAGTVMVVLRFTGLKRSIRELNLPGGLLGCGLIILTVNLALPIYFRSLLDDAMSDWAPRNQFIWLAGLPLIQCLAVLLPRRSHRGGTALQRSWLPIGIFELWLAGTAVHLWCLAYVGKVDCEPYMLAPLLWALTWTVFARITDFTSNPAPTLRMTLLCAPAMGTFLGAFYENSYVFLALTILNVLIYGWLFASGRDKQLAFQLLLASVVGLAAGFPLNAGSNLLPESSRGHWIAVALGGFVLLQSFFSRRPQVGFCGATVVALAPSFLGLEPRFHLSIQTASAFLLVHSLGWVERERNGAPAILRMVAATAWMTHSLAYTYVEPVQSMWLVSAAAVLVMCVSVGARLVSGAWATLVLPLSASVSLLAAPANYVLRKLIASPAGLLAIVASFVLFGLGTLLALSKPIWHRPPANENEPP